MPCRGRITSSAKAVPIEPELGTDKGLRVVIEQSDGRGTELGRDAGSVLAPRVELLELRVDVGQVGLMATDR